MENVGKAEDIKRSWEVRMDILILSVLVKCGDPSIVM